MTPPRKHEPAVLSNKKRAPDDKMEKEKRLTSRDDKEEKPDEKPPTKELVNDEQEKEDVCSSTNSSPWVSAASSSADTQPRQMQEERPGKPERIALSVKSKATKPDELEKPPKPTQAEKNGNSTKVINADKDRLAFRTSADWWGLKSLWSIPKPPKEGVPIGRYVLRAFDAKGELPDMAINNACMVFGSTLRHAHISDTSHDSVKGQHAAMIFVPPETMSLEAINGECTITSVHAHPQIVAKLESEQLRLQTSTNTEESIKVPVGTMAKNLSASLNCIQLAKSEIVFLMQDKQVMAPISGKSSSSAGKRKEETVSTSAASTKPEKHSKAEAVAKNVEDIWEKQERAWRDTKSSQLQEPLLETKRRKGSVVDEAPPGASRSGSRGKKRRVRSSSGEAPDKKSTRLGRAKPLRRRTRSQSASSR